MEIFDIIKRRRTIRSFTDKKIESEKLDMMAEAARYAPSGANLQPLKYAIVESEGVCKEVFKTLKWAGYTAPKGVPTEADAPQAYIVILIDQSIRKDGDNDACYAGENIVLLAESMGIGSCIIGSVDRPRLKEILSLSDNLRIHTVIALGYPNQNSYSFDMEDNNIKYYLDENNNFHVPKRKFEDITTKF